MEFGHVAHGAPNTTQPIPVQILDAIITPTFRDGPLPASVERGGLDPVKSSTHQLVSSHGVRQFIKYIYIYIYIYGWRTRLPPLPFRVEG